MMLSNDFMRRYLAWETICLPLLTFHRPNARIERNQSVRLPNGRSYESDAILVEGQRREVVEIKLYRSSYLPGNWLAQVLERLDQSVAAFRADAGILMISARLLPDQVSGYRTRRKIEVLDIDVLRGIAVRAPELLQQLDIIATERGIPLDVPRDAAATRPQYTTAIPPGAARAKSDQRVNAQAVASAGFPRKGDEMIERLRATRPGKKYYVEFERSVLAALQYIFFGQLDKWTAQLLDDNRLRRDVCAKIVGSHTFWHEMVRDFRTRFVIFECKNYTAQISQNEIHSTEKYLYVPALRSLAIMVTRHGVDEGAVRAMRGALREAGKLIMWLSIDDLCEMLRARDGGGEVHEILAQRLDDLLLAISR
jgi:hypothetical protein